MIDLRHKKYPTNGQSFATGVLTILDIGGLDGSKRPIRHKCNLPKMR